MTLALANNTLGEDFNDPSGRLVNYDSYDIAQKAQIDKQRHIDIRTFVQDTESVPQPLRNLDTQTIASLDAQPLSTLESYTVIRRNENWSAGAVGVQLDRNDWTGLSLTCPVGITTAISFSQNYDGPESLDLWTDFQDDDVISLALPAFPLNDLDLANSFIEFEASGVNTMIPFADSVIPLINGDSELRFDRSLLFVSRLDREQLLSEITGVQFSITATTACTFRCLAIRLLSKDWVYGPLDTDTLNQRLVRPVSLDGSATPTFTFPSSATNDPRIPSDWPVLFRAAEPPGTQDPRPVDVSLAMAVNTGSLTQATGDPAINIFRLYFRETSQAFVTQLDLDPTDLGGTTMADLDALGHQPDYTGDIHYQPRRQSEFDTYGQSSLDTRTQSDLERKGDPLDASWLEVDLQWSAQGTQLTIQDTQENRYTFSPPLIATTDYLMLVDLKENSVRVRICELDYSDEIKSPIFDTRRITDMTLLARLQGRFGWYAHLLDGNAHIGPIRTRSVCFAEYRSAPFESITPLSGAQIFVNSTPDPELWTGVKPAPAGGEVYPEYVKSNSGRAFRVISGVTPLEGFQTNVVYLDDFTQASIEFDLNFPSLTKNNLEALLIGKYGHVFNLTLENVSSVRWQHFSLDLSQADQTLQTGPYRFALVQPTTVKTTWYIDNISIKQRVISWDGRCKLPDAWDLEGDNWTPYQTVYNELVGGVLFPEYGNTLQIRAQAHRQNASFSQLKIVPRYAEMGRFVWRDNSMLRDNLPQPTFTVQGV